MRGYERCDNSAISFASYGDPEEATARGPITSALKPINSENTACNSIQNRAKKLLDG